MSKLKNQDEEEEEEDRISNLPDSLLITVLSLLPINSAAATSAVSRRWRHLWTHLTHISLPPLRQSPAFDKRESFVATVDHIFSQLNSPKIHSFKLCLLFNDADMFKVSSWIRQVCLRDPEILQVSAYYFRDQIYKVPICILQTRSLVQLELNNLLEFDEIPDYGLFNINLPNLKKLKVCLYDSDRWLMSNLCKSCPLLEDLNMSMHNLDHDHDVDISAPNLKFLKIYVADTCLSIVLTFVIDAPMLERCHIEGYLMYFHFVEKPTSLRQVTLSINDSVSDDDSDYHNKILVLFRGISCAEYLILNEWEVDLLSLLGEVALPIFGNLIHLDIVHYDKDKEWDSFPCLPASLLANLEQLDLHNLVGNNDLEIKMIQDMLTKATVLKQLHVHELILESLEEDKLRKEYDFCVKLFTLSESSSSCRIKFFGDIIIASSEDFKGGVLTCQINKH